MLNAVLDKSSHVLKCIDVGFDLLWLMQMVQHGLMIKLNHLTFLLSLLFFNFSKVLNYVGHWLLIYTDTLLENMKCLSNYIKLGDNLL